MPRSPVNSAGVAATATGPSSIVEAMMASKRMHQALAEVVPGNWPKDRKFFGAAQVKAIAGVLIEYLHKHLVNVEIGYLYREAMQRGDRVTLGKATRVGGKLQFYTELEFHVEINWTAWMQLKPEQRVALVDHELCHFNVEDTEKGTRYVLVAHDVEEFGAIVRRWGLWLPDLRKFEAAIAQRDLFEVVDQDDDADETEQETKPDDDAPARPPRRADVDD